VQTDAGVQYPVAGIGSKQNASGVSYIVSVIATSARYCAPELEALNLACGRFRQHLHEVDPAGILIRSKGFLAVGDDFVGKCITGTPQGS